MSSQSRFISLFPRILFALTVSLAPFVGGRREIMGTSAVCCVAFAAAFVLILQKEFLKPKSVLLFLAFIALLAASGLVTESIHSTIETGLYFTACAVVCMVASSAFAGQRGFLATLALVSIISIILAALGLNEYASSEPGWRVFATFESPGYFGGFLAIILPLMLGWLFYFKSIYARAAALCAWMLVSAALFLTGTRFALLYAIISCFITLALLLKNRLLSRPRAAMCLIAVVGAIIMFIVAGHPLSSRLAGETAAEQSHSLPFRIATWHGTIKMIEAHPMLGTGAGTFQIAFPRYAVAGPTRMAHNGYLQLAAEAGVPALIVMLAAILVLLRECFRGLKDNASVIGDARIMVYAALGAVSAGILRNFTDSDLYNPGIGIIFWALLGVLAAVGGSVKIAKPRIWVRVVLEVFFVGAIVILYTFILGEVRAEQAAARLEGENIGSGTFESAAAIDPLNASRWLALANYEAVFASTPADWDRAIGYVQRAARLEPTRAKYQLAMAEMYLRKGEKQRAIDCYRYALRLDRHATVAMLALAKLLPKPESEVMYRKLLQEEESPYEKLKGVPELVNPDFAWAHVYFGKKLLNSGDYSGAARHFKSAIDRLEKRKHYEKFLEAAQLAGLVNPEEEQDLDMLLAESKRLYAEAVKHAR